MAIQVGLTEAERDLVIGILKSRLTTATLRKILDAIQKRSKRGGKSIEWIVAETERPDGPTGKLTSRLPDTDLAGFLVDLAGPDLLENSEVRRRLAQSASPDELDTLHEYPSDHIGRGETETRVNAVARRRWHPGKGWAGHFARTLGLPAIFAGLRGDPTEADEIEVDPFVPLPPLQPFQEELQKDLLEVLVGEPGSNRGILTLPTGAGKTRTAVEALVKWRLAAPDTRAILWIAQSEELCEQAVQAFREVWIDLGHRSDGTRQALTVRRLWGVRRVTPYAAGIVVASIQKLYAIVRGARKEGEDVDKNKRTLAAMAKGVGAVVIDEAHRMLASSYTEVLRFLGVEVGRGASSDTPILGLTATPYRAVDEETRRLATRFHGRLLTPHGLGDDPIATLRVRGVLSSPTHHVASYSGPPHAVNDDPKYRKYFERFGDLHPDLLRKLGRESARNKELLRIIMNLPPEWPTLFFACSVEHARAMTVLLKRQGRTAAAVSSLTRAATRRFLIEEFREGRISVLCNYGVLTTGFDAPCVRALVISRPTASPVLYEQMIGRGMRGPVFGGTKECLVVDVADNIRFRGQLAFRRYDEYWSLAT